MNIRYLDICAGVSAFSLAIAPMGWECAGYAEVDPFASAILAARFGATQPIHMPDPEEDAEWLTPDDRRNAIKALKNYHWGDRVTNFGDFTKIRSEDVGSIDVLVGGIPCQAFSIAGLREGLDDPRGDLTLEFMALARRLRPQWLVWENVPGVLSIDSGKVFGTILRLMGELGYGWAYRVLDAQFIRVDGIEMAVPQRRQRLFVVGCLGSSAGAAAVLFDRRTLRGDPCPRRTAKSDLAATASGNSDGGSKAIVARKLGHDRYTIDDVGSTIKARDSKDATDLVIRHPEVSRTLMGEGHDASEDGSRRGMPLIVAPKPVTFPAFMSGTQCASDDRDVAPTIQATNPTAVAFAIQDASGQSKNQNGLGISESGVSYTVDTKGMQGVAVVPFDTTQITNPNNRSNPSIGDPATSLTSSGKPPAIAFQERGRPDGRTVEFQEEVAYCLTSPNSGGRKNEAIAANWSVRRFTPLECERLMGMPDGHTLIDCKRRQRVAVDDDFIAYWSRIRGYEISLAEAQHMAPDSPRYRVIGNSMPVNVMRWLASGIDVIHRATSGTPWRITK